MYMKIYKGGLFVFVSEENKNAPKYSSIWDQDKPESLHMLEWL